MSKLGVSITMSLDGFVAGPNQSLEHPLGEGGIHLHDWAVSTRTFRSLHGDTGGGETGVNDDVIRESFENIGATTRSASSPSAPSKARAPRISNTASANPRLRKPTRRAGCAARLRTKRIYNRCRKQQPLRAAIFHAGRATRC
ncbi:MAG: hypothetical protein ACREIA_16380 [Opitutaceae bacterium]